MVAAVGDKGRGGAVVETGAQAYANPRTAGQWTQAPDQHDRTEGALVVLEARREIGDFYRAAMLIVKRRDQDGRIFDIALLGAGEVQQFDTPEARLRLFLAAQQRAEYRIAIETRHTAPSDLRPLVDKG